VNGAEAARALLRLGFLQKRQTGSHLVLRRESRTVVVPQHKPLNPGTLKGILEQAGVLWNSFWSNFNRVQVHGPTFTPPGAGSGATGIACIIGVSTST
jgi:predicted RNA binding protein YcfA (HicA-like mRNA interferase family)